jgi:hypothetical protein
MRSDQIDLERLANGLALALSDGALPSVNQVESELRIRRPDLSDSDIDSVYLQASSKKSSEQNAVETTENTESNTMRHALNAFSSSISLLFGSGGGGGLPAIVTWESITQDRPESEWLTSLDKVEYIEDLFFDWAQVRQYLQNEQLMQSDQVVALYRKWFHQTRTTSNPEYREFQVDLVEDLVANIGQGDGSVNTMALYAAMDMFTCWVDSCALYLRTNERMRNVGNALWSRMVNDDDDNNNNKSVWVEMVQHSPHADMFYLWIAFQSSVDHVLALEGMDKVWTRAVEEHSLFALSILRSVFTVTRVSKFPWERIQTNKKQCGAEGTAAELLSSCLQTLETLFASDAIDWRSVRICADLTDTLCQGSTSVRPPNMSKLDFMLKSLQTHVGDCIDARISYRLLHKLHENEHKDKG